MRRLLAALVALIGTVVPITAVVTAEQASAASPDIYCNPPSWWYDNQIQQYINDGLPSATSGLGAVTVPAEDPALGTSTAAGRIQICGDVPYDGIWYIRFGGSASFPDNALGVQLVRNPSTGKPQGPTLGYNASFQCGDFYNWCPIVAGEYPFEAQTEWRVVCYPGYPGYVSFQSYYTGLYMTVGPNIFYNNPGAPLLEQSGEYYEGAGIGAGATTYIVPGLCGAT